MVDAIDELKQKYTDKYVVVDGSRPELARFRDTYGTVKTVNMSGRALVEFADYHLNIGWYDIDPSFLKLIDAPLPPKPKEAAPAKAPKGEAASAAGKPAAKPKPAAAAPAAGAKPSTADILAKLRGGAAKPAGEPASAGGSAPAKPAKPAAAKSAATPTAPAGKVDRSKMSVADMLAAARAGKAGNAAPAAAEPAPAEEAPAESAEEVVEAPAPAAKPAISSGPLDKKTMSIADMCAWCREHDTK
jgi:hypothetical protein